MDDIKSNKKPVQPTGSIPPAPNQHPQIATPPVNDPIGAPGTLGAPGSVGQSVDTVKIKPKKYRFRQFYGIASLIQLIVGALILAFVINQFVFQSYEVFGRSMTPTLQEQDRLIISKLGRSWSNLFNSGYIPSRGEIIVFKSPRNPNVQLIKRVIGIPGDRVVVDDGIITVYNDENPGGFNPDEGYEDELAETRTGDVELEVLDNELFVSGDNRAPGGSLDSRNDLGLVPVENIIGELVLRIYPFGDAAAF